MISNYNAYKRCEKAPRGGKWPPEDSSCLKKVAVLRKSLRFIGKDDWLSNEHSDE